MARASDDTDGAAAINVTMEGGRIVICPSGPLDDDALDAVRGLLAGARAAGAAAVLDLSRIDRRADVVA